MRREHEKGITLIEMTVLLAILGIVLAVVVQGTSGLLRSNRLTGATNMLVADLHYARALATKEGRSFQVAFQPGGYSIVRVPTAETVLARSCPGDVSCSATNPATFFPWGLTVPSTITLKNSEHTKVLRLAANGSVSHD